MKQCSVYGCERKYLARGLCKKHYDRERRADPEWRAKENARRRERYRSDPEYRKRENARTREWQRERSGDPEWRAKENARLRTPEWRERHNARRRARRATDPEFRERENTRNRERYHCIGRGYRKHLPQLIAHQRNLCAICKKRLPKNPSKVHVDHIVHVSNGGGNDPVNLRATHARCNLSRHNRWLSGQPQLPLD